ncbi:unnamed protein product [Trichogramma brassicae]|uniref:Tim10-like domain-containing protein n=1 Tax=Trichogramma brassicae TaxID=86971 RepID=A0A6H5J134_9HYME|nr:unnamed protein product [Trichogramma brassicae]
MPDSFMDVSIQGRTQEQRTSMLTPASTPGIKNNDRCRSLLGYLMTGKLAHSENKQLRDQFSHHIRDIKQWLEKTPTSMDARVEVVEVFDNLKRLDKPSAISKTWSAVQSMGSLSRTSLLPSKTPGASIQCILNALVQENAFVLLQGWDSHVNANLRPLVEMLDNVHRKDPLTLPREYFPVAYSCEMLVAAFISGSTRRYDAKFVAELFTEEEKYSKRYKPTTKFPKDFFAERKSIFEFIGNTAPEMLEFIFYALQKLRPIKSGTTITGWVPEDRPYRGSIIRDTGVQYDAEYRVHELMRRLAAYVHFKGTNEYPRLTEINPCEYFTRKRKVVKCIFWDEFKLIASTTKPKPKSGPKERVKSYDAQTQTDKVSPMELVAIRAHVTPTEAVALNQLVIEPNNFSIRHNPFITRKCRLETLQRRLEQISSTKAKINETVEKLMASYMLLDEEEEGLKVNLAEMNNEIERENIEKEEARRIVEEKIRADKLLAQRKNEALASECSGVSPVDSTRRLGSWPNSRNFRTICIPQRYMQATWKCVTPDSSVQPVIDEDKMKLVQELEIEMMSDMYNRMTRACHKKCIAPKYAENELGKGEAVCIDRCVAKYLDVHERVGKRLTQISMQEENFMKGQPKPG